MNEWLGIDCVPKMLIAKHYNLCDKPNKCDNVFLWLRVLIVNLSQLWFYFADSQFMLNCDSHRSVVIFPGVHKCYWLLRLKRSPHSLYIRYLDMTINYSYFSFHSPWVQQSRFMSGYKKNIIRKFVNYGFRVSNTLSLSCRLNSMHA